MRMNVLISRGKRAALVLLALIAVIILSGCSLSPVKERENLFDTAYLEDISPRAATETFETGTATLYFRMNNESLLAPVLGKISLPVDKTKEELVIEALLGGAPMNHHEMTNVIPAGTELVSAYDRDTYLEITLSKEFFDISSDVPGNWADIPEWRREVLERRRLATYSIVNSITELGNYSSVLILIDTAGDGSGQRVNRSEFGLVSEGGGDEPMEPLRRDSMLIITPKKVCAIVLDAIITQQIDSALHFLDFGQEGAPSSQAIADSLYRAGLSSYNLDAYGDTVVRLDGAAAVITVDYETMLYTASGRTGHFAYPLSLKLVDAVWRIDYASLCGMMAE